jgi:hypothetical protein
MFVNEKIIFDGKSKRRNILLNEIKKALNQYIYFIIIIKKE